MSKFTNTARRIADAADKVVYFIGGTGLLLCAGMCGANILMWWFFGKRIAICDEISLFGLIWATYIGMGLLFRNNAHCTMDFVVEALPPKMKTVLRILTDLLILVIAALTVYYSWKLAAKSLTKKLVLTKIPYFYVDISVTLGYGHLLILVIADMIKNIKLLMNWGREGKN